MFTGFYWIGSAFGIGGVVSRGCAEGRRYVEEFIGFHEDILLSISSEFDKYKMDLHIEKFIKKHHVLTLATSFDNEPWTANCFYTWLEEEDAFVFTSDSDTKHIRDLAQGDKVAGSVVLETNVVGEIRGIQFTGKLYEPWDELMKKSKRAYLKRFPYAALMKTQLWVLEVGYVKMTDNRLGFGKKRVWRRGGE